MAYPIEIMPKGYYRHYIDLNYLLAFSKAFYVCRLIDKPIDDIIQEDADGSEILDIDAFKHHIVGMSVNLMGGLFNETHFPYRPIGKGAEDWDGREINISDFSQHYKDGLTVYPVYYSSDVVHRIPLNHDFLKPEKSRIKSLKETFTEDCMSIFGNKYSVKCEIFISHRPTNLNYWHMQLEMKPAMEDDLECFEDEKACKKDIYNELKSNILTKKFLRVIPNQQIPLCSYCGIGDNCQKKRIQERARIHVVNR